MGLILWCFAQVALRLGSKIVAVVHGDSFSLVKLNYGNICIKG